MEKKNNPDCNLPVKIMQEERYTESFSHSRGSSSNCKTEAITWGSFLRHRCSPLCEGAPFLPLTMKEIFVDLD